MKMVDRERVAGTWVTIGRRVVHRKTRRGRESRPYATYSAEYTDVSGKRVTQGLGTRNRSVARRKALEIQERLEKGAERERYGPVLWNDLTEQFLESRKARGAAPKTLAKYGSEADKLRAFAAERGVERADRFDERSFDAYRAWLIARRHKQGVPYADKSIHASLTFVKSVLKWGWRVNLLPRYALANVALPSARPRPQPCFTTEQVDAIIEATSGRERAAFTILAFSGMRVNELVQLEWEDVLFERGELGMLHIRRGGSAGTTKDKDDRFVPIHPRVRLVLEGLPRISERVLPGLRDRRLLARLKAVCRDLGFGQHYKVHSFRHYFASTVANSSVPYRMALAWLGHSSSDILDHYYHLHDAESEAAMRSLA